MVVSTLDGAEIAGRPGRAEQVFGGGVRLGELQLQLAVAAARAAVGAADIVGRAGEDDLAGHG
jgi:hypothetical protein